MERFIFKSNGTSGPNKINTQEIGNSHEQKNKVQKKGNNLILSDTVFSYDIDTNSNKTKKMYGGKIINVCIFQYILSNFKMNDNALCI